MALRVRLTVRGMMIAMAIVAILLFAAIRLNRAARAYRARATAIGYEEAFHRREIQRTAVVIANIYARLRAVNDAGVAKYRRLLDEQRGELARNIEHANYRAALRRKYEHAARQPWLPVSPDPPPPD